VEPPALAHSSNSHAAAQQLNPISTYTPAGSKACSEDGGKKQQQGEAEEGCEQLCSASSATADAQAHLLQFEQQAASTPAAAGSTRTTVAGSSHANSTTIVPATFASDANTLQLDSSGQQQLSGPAAAIFRLLSSAEHSALPSQQEQQQQQQAQSDPADVLLLQQALVKAAQEHQVNMADDAYPQLLL
jgi:hypothetical protein